MLNFESFESFDPVIIFLLSSSSPCLQSQWITGSYDPIVHPSPLSSDNLILCNGLTFHSFLIPPSEPWSDSELPAVLHLIPSSLLLNNLILYITLQSFICIPNPGWFSQNSYKVNSPALTLYFKLLY